MSELVIKTSIPEWVKIAQAGETTYCQRQVTEFILQVITITPSLN